MYPNIFTQSDSFMISVPFIRFIHDTFTPFKPLKMYRFLERSDALHDQNRLFDIDLNGGNLVLLNCWIRFLVSFQTTIQYTARSLFRAGESMGKY